MTITGLVVAKAVLVSLGVAMGIGVAAAATGNLHGLTVALQNVPSWTHAHSVLNRLFQGM